jgi:hypothetical protein
VLRLAYEKSPLTYMIAYSWNDFSYRCLGGLGVLGGSILLLAAL